MHFNFGGNPIGRNETEASQSRATKTPIRSARVPIPISIQSTKMGKSSHSEGPKNKKYIADERANQNKLGYSGAKNEIATVEAKKRKAVVILRNIFMSGIIQKESYQ